MRRKLAPEVPAPKQATKQGRKFGPGRQIPTNPIGEDGKYDLSAVREARAKKEKRHAWVGKGRPSTYQGEVHNELAYDLRLLGLTVEQIATVMRVEDQTIYHWLEKYEDFRGAWEAGGHEADAIIARAIYHRAKGYSRPTEKIFYDAKAGRVVRAKTKEHFPPDVGAATFWLTNRQKARWKNRQDTSLSGPDGAPLEPPSVTIMGLTAEDT